MNPTIRVESPADFLAVEQIHREAFGGEYEPTVARKLREDPDYIPELSLVAEHEGRILGHIVLSRMRFDDPARPCTLLGLGPVGVVPSMQKQGVGSALIREAIERARAMGFSGIVLLGHPSYYPRFGFQPASRCGISFNYDVPDEVAMALPLTTEPLAGGKLFYSPAFDR